MPQWTAEQITALAPDSGSLKAGKELASARKWLSLGCSDQAVWGECQGSAKDPYQTQIDLSEPAFKCSCPSRKFPCKHALGLFLLFAAQPGLYKPANPPAWVAEWLIKRAQPSQKPAKAKEKSEPASNSGPDSSEAAAGAARRAARREERIRQGLADLDLWLCDLLRQGLSMVQAQPQSFWETPAARLVDVQAPGLARRVRDLAAVPDSGEGWQVRLLSQTADLYLLVEGYLRIETLPPETQADLRTQIGWTQDQDELLLQAGLRDRWMVLGRRVEEQALGVVGRSPLKVQRTWLWGSETHRSALLLSFAAPGQVLDTTLIPGTSLDAELVFFPGGFPLRALLKKQYAAPQPLPALPGYAQIEEAFQACAAALAANPWLDLYPMPLHSVTPVQSGERWGLRDTANRFLPISPAYPLVWTLVALSGGHPLALFGEWDGATLWPLSVLAGERFILLRQVKADD